MKDYYDRKTPECMNCIHADGCPEAEEGKFCTMFRSREPEDRGPDPAEEWAKGNVEDIGR